MMEYKDTPETYAGSPKGLQRLGRLKVVVHCARCFWSCNRVYRPRIANAFR
jgi:hypothetical protein